MYCLLYFIRNSSALCPRSEFTCSARFSEHAATIPLHSISRVVVVMETQCVSCEAGNGYLNINYINSKLQRNRLISWGAVMVFHGRVVTVQW
jgi:hypothetical protein